MARRALHYVLKIGNRAKNIEFFRDLLGMKVLRHEEFHTMCEAQCNGPYDGKWSKTMIGYGPESDKFVLELTYNYGVSNYKLGNDLVSIRIESKSAYEQILKNDKGFLFMHKNPESIVLTNPDGYMFEVYNPEHDQSLISKVSLLSSNLEVSKNYWHNFLGMNLDEEASDHFTVSFGDKDAKLEIVDSRQTPVRHEKAILADPDKHEICFVGSKGFDDLSKVDPNANQLIEDEMAKDKSDEWFKKKGIEKEKQE
ncbi:Glyoxalase domain-containing protein 4 [Tyrophagus putrescentiae]|nr:Glyoxalase domain-containing protein 4 [Tyrophagus putrescentiae]